MPTDPLITTSTLTRLIDKRRNAVHADTESLLEKARLDEREREAALSKVRPQPPLSPTPKSSPAKG